MEPVLTHPGMGEAVVETCARGQLNFVLRKCYGYGFGSQLRNILVWEMTVMKQRDEVEATAC